MELGAGADRGGRWRKALRDVFGEVQWTPPPWVASTAGGWSARLGAARERLRKAREENPLLFRHASAAALGLVVIGLSGIRWYRHRPQPIRFDIQVAAPALTVYDEKGVRIQPLSVAFDGSAARLAQIGKAVTRGITLLPPIKGDWKWESDRRLVFTPKDDWRVGQDYSLSLDRSLFPPHVRLKRYDARFRSAPFAARIASSEFYQDPVNPKVKRVIATVAFSHPVNTTEVEAAVTLVAAGRDAGILGFGARGFPRAVAFNKLKTEAYVASDPVQIPKDDGVIRVQVKGGAHAARGGPPFKADLAADVTVPGMFTFFHVDGAELEFARNERYEPEQVLILRLSAGALESEIQGGLEAFELPTELPSIQGRPAQSRYRWHSVDMIGPEILALSRKLVLDPVPTDKRFATLHSFKYKAEPGRQVYVRLRRGVRSYGDYVLAKEFDRVLTVRPFPKELQIMHDGALLSMSGDKKLSILSRGVGHVRFEVGRVIGGQVNHLVSQSRGQFRDPHFVNHGFGSDNITERFTSTRELARVEAGKTQYSAFDLSEYLSGGEDHKRGLFFFKVQEWDPVHKRATGVEDRRLVLVTDLGVLVKELKAGGSAVFVQSIRTGAPVAGAQVQVLGRNGVAVLSSQSDELGHAEFPSLKTFEREKQPTAYLVRKGSDLSFLPYQWADRRLNLSRFDVGGVVTEAGGDGLQAYLFTDRGLYRPGDEWHVGLIVKSRGWGQELAGVPIEEVITDPRGQEVYKRKASLNDSGFQEISFRTEETSATGVYQASVYIVKDEYRAKLLGSTSVRVEEFLPDRMRITARFSSERAEGWVSPKELKGLVTLKNLFGTPAADRRVLAELTLTPSFPAFRAHPGFTFTDPLRAKRSFAEPLPDGRTDAAGEVSFALDLEKFEKATYRLGFAAEGFEAEGGRGVAAEAGVLVSPLEHLIGYKADGDLRYLHKESKRSVELIAVDPTLAKVAVSGLKLQLVELRHVSVLTRQPNGTYRYESVQKEYPVRETPFAVSAGGERVALPTGRAGEFAYVVRDGADAEMSRVVFNVIGRANLSRSLDKNAELQVRLDKADYAPGEEIELQIKAPYAGAGLITIERDKVYAFKWFTSDTTGSVHRIRVPASLEGNGYLNVSMLRSMDSPEVYMSPLSYGVVPFSVSRARRTNAVMLESPALARPGEDLRIKYRTAKPGRIVVFAVDEGILQTAGYRTPDPLAHFLAKRALEVDTEQILDLVLPEFRHVRELSSPGGDAGRAALGKNLNPFKRKRDKPVVFWSGILPAGPGGGEAVYRVPDYFSGALRVMAVVVSPDSIGVAERQATVRGHFVLTPNAPTVAAPGDEFDVSVGLANVAEGSGADARVSLELRTSPNLEALGAKAAEVKVSEHRETSAVFRLRARDGLGSANMTFTASFGDKRSTVSVDLSVRPPVPYMTTVAGGVVASGKTEVPVVRRMHPQYRTLEAAASTVPLVLARGLLRYLNKFPYGCTEQLVSQAFPAIVLQHRPEFGFAPADVQSSLEQIVRILRARQNAEGAFGYWAANSHVSDMASVHALHFLTEAKDHGYPVPPDLLNRGLGYLNALASGRIETMADARARTYAAYLLVRNGIVATGPILSLRRQLDELFAKDWKKDMAAVHLAAAYRLLKQNGQADALIAGARMGESQADDYEHLYDGLVRDAQLLYVLARHFPERLKSLEPDALLRLAEPVAKGRFNTLSSAYVILALDAYVEAVGLPKASEIRVAELRRGKPPVELPLPSGLFPRVEFSDSAETILIASKAEAPLFYGVTTAGFDLSVPKAEIKEGLEIQREYRDANGAVVDRVAMGGEVEARLKVRSVGTKRVANAAVMDLLPGGFEVILERTNRRSSTRARAEDEAEEGTDGAPAPAAPTGAAWRPDHADIREDRVVLFGSIGPEVQEYVYKLRATNRGRFAVPPAYAESMYDRDLRARSLASGITVE
ncbi:MAG: alpha-2-macroglobulin [Elusimicrobia bacterium]|nr:alpha-2-macroglobulin [Elusimicrobiota bacterium]